MGRWGRSERGSYTLEFIGVFVGIAVLMVSVADVVRIFQARSAIRAAVHDGLRCLYPTDAGCSDVTEHSSSPPWKRYNVKVWGAGYRIPRESFAATARWLTEPVYEAPIDEHSLVAVNVERDQHQYAELDVLYPTRATSAYLAQTRPLPRVNNGTPFEPYFVDPITRERAVPRLNISLSRVKASTTDGSAYWETDGFLERFKIGSVSFSLRGAWPSADTDRESIRNILGQGGAAIGCYSGPLSGDPTTGRISWGAGVPEQCSYRGDTTGIWRNHELAVPLMFRVSGSTKGTHRLGDGRVLLRMSWRGTAGEGSLTLGGRRITAGGSGNFVPRGLAWEDIRDNLEGQYKDYGREIDLYGKLPLIPRDSTVTIEFFLVSVNRRSVTWSGDAIEVFYPQYALQQESHPCGYSREPTQCVSLPPGPVTKISVPPDAAPQLQVSQGAVCSPEKRSDAVESEKAVLDRVTQQIRRGEALSPSRFVVGTTLDREVCLPYRQRVPCVSTPPTGTLRGCRDEGDSTTLLKRCENSLADVSPVRFISAEWQVRGDARTETFRGCSEPRLPECARVGARHVRDEIWSPHADAVGSCPESEEQVAPPLLIGPLSESSCRDRGSEIQSVYRERERIPSGAIINVVRSSASPLYSGEPPPDTCTPYRPADGSDERLVCGRGVSAARAERCCAAASGRCESEEVVYPGGMDGEYASALIDVATRRVVEGVQAGYPQARYQEQCRGEEADCVEVHAQVFPEDLTAKVSARMKIPLRALRLVTGADTSVEYAAERKLERHVFSY